MTPIGPRRRLPEVTRVAILLIAFAPSLARAQSLEPRLYLPFPTGTSLIAVSYLHSSGSVVFDWTTPVTDAHATMNSFAVLHRRLSLPNHVNIVRNARGTFAYVTVGGLNEVKVFRTDDFTQIAAIPVGKLPHGI